MAKYQSAQLVRNNNFQYVRTAPVCHGEPVTLGSVYLGPQNGAKSLKKKCQLLLEYLWSLCAHSIKARIYCLISFVSAAKPCSLQRLEGFLLSESHFTTE